VFSQIAPPQYFSVSLIASTHAGFASAIQSFNVVIGAHSLEIDPTTQYANTSIGANLTYNFPLDNIKLDDKTIDHTNISFITADLGDNGNWLQFDNTSMVLSGQPTKGDKGTTVYITVQDVFADTVRSTIVVDLFDGLFTTALPSTVNATVGKAFSFVLNDTFFAASDVQVSVDFKPNDGDNWLSYDSTSRTISGTPEADKAQSVEVDINASSASLSQKQTSSFTVQSVSSSGAVSSQPTSSSSSSSHKSLAIGLGVSLPLIALALCALLICWRRLRRRSSKSSIRAGSPVPAISRPYNTTPDGDWPLEEEKSWGEPRQLGGMEMFKRGVSGMFTLKTSEVGTTAATVGNDAWQHDPENEKALPTPMIGGPRELPKAARGSWRRSDGRDWASIARTSDASLATVSTNEIFSIRLVQSPNPNTGGLNPMSQNVGGVSPLLGGMGIRGAAPVVNVHPPPEENGPYNGERSQETIGTFSEGSSGVDYEGNHWESADRMFPHGGRGSGLGAWKADRSPSTYSVDSFQSGDQPGYDDNERGTWYQKRESSRDTIDDAVEYPVSRVSGPLSPVSPNIEWAAGNGTPGRPRLVEFTKEKRAESASSSGHGSGEVAFV
jgi:hypothetical protein